MHKSNIIIKAAAAAGGVMSSNVTIRNEIGLLSVTEVTSLSQSDINGGHNMSATSTHANKNFVDRECAGYFGACLGLQCGWLAVSLVFFFILFYIGVVMSALSSAVITLTLTRHYFRQQVTMGQMVVCFFEAIVWYGPVALLDVVWLVAIRPLTPEEGICMSCIFGYIIRYMFFAAFNEELIKLFVIYRMFLSPMTNGLSIPGTPIISPPLSSDNRNTVGANGDRSTDHPTVIVPSWNWKALVVYGVCVGAGMGSVENVYKVFLGGWFTAFKRTFTPFHVLSGRSPGSEVCCCLVVHINYVVVFVE
jgi:hypothetical protein